MVFVSAGDKLRTQRFDGYMVLVEDNEDGFWDHWGRL